MACAHLKKTVFPAADQFRDQEKDAAERKVTVALAYADAQQQAARELKQQLNGEAPSAEEASASKPMERWLF